MRNSSRTISEFKVVSDGRSAASVVGIIDAHPVLGEEVLAQLTKSMLRNTIAWFLK